MDEEALFAAALAITVPAERRTFLAEACRGDRHRLAQVEALLHAHEHPDPFLQPATAPVRPTFPEPITEGPGTVVGAYKLLEQIGEGGFGVIFLAEQQEPVRRKVALKVLKPGMDTRQVVARFEAERQALALMDHPNIAQVFDGGQTASGRPFFVMELVKGVPITQYCDEYNLPIDERLGLFASICQAIQHAHQKGIIHRDLKPSNILVSLQDSLPIVKVIDFGIAKATGAQLTDKTLFTNFGQIIGTPVYMSPEQAQLNAVDIDTRTDIYALGVLLYELLTGTTPFDAERLRTAGYDEMRRIIREEEPVPPSTRISTLGQSAPTVSAQRQCDPRRLRRVLRRELDWIVMKALEKDRNRRYETASAFVADVLRYLHDEPVLACPPSAAYRLRKFIRRQRGRLIGASVVTVGLLVALAVVASGLYDLATRQAEDIRRAQELFSAARGLLIDKALAPESQAARARQKLAEARSLIAKDRALHGNVADEVEALEAELKDFERFVELEEQAHDAEFSQAATFLGEADAYAGAAKAPELLKNLGRDPDAAIPYLAKALSIYAALDEDDWSARLEGGLLGPDQVARVRRTGYEQLLWLADDSLRRQIDHRAARALSPPESAQAALTYLGRAEHAVSLTPAFYHIRSRCRHALGDEGAARQDEQSAGQIPKAIALDHYLLALAAFDARNQAESVRHCEAALRLEPTHFWSLLLLGTSLGSLGITKDDYAASALTLTGCILKRPDHAYAYLCRGNAFYKLKRINEAEADFRTALNLRPHSAEAHTNLGNAQRAQGDLAAAEKEYRASMRLRPTFAGAHTNLGMVLAEQGKLDEAETECREALHLRPDLPNAHANLGNVLRQLGKPVDAEKAYREAIRLRPEFRGVHTNLGVALYEQGKLREAEEAHREDLRLDPDNAGAHCNLGVTLRARGKRGEAEKEQREALRLWPDFPEAHFNLGNILSDHGKHADAAKELRAAIHLRPNFADAHFRLGQVMGLLGDLAEGARECREALRLRPNFPEARTILGAALYAQGHHAEAEAEFSEALRLRPNYPPAQRGVRTARWHLTMFPDPASGDPKRTLDAAQQAVVLMPKDGVVRLALGVAQYRAGNSQAALESLQHAMALRDGGDPCDWFTVAMVHWQQANKETARQWYDKAVQAMADHRRDDWLRFHAEAAALLHLPLPPLVPCRQIPYQVNHPPFTINVLGLAFTPDSRHVLATGDGNDLRLFEVETGKEIHRFTGHTQWVYALALSADGRLALSGGQGKTLRLWDLDTRKEVRQFSGHTTAVRFVGFSPDGKQAVSGGHDDPAIWLWDVETGKRTRQFTGHGGALHHAVFLPNGKEILSASVDKTIRLWNAESGEEVRRFDNPGATSFVCVSPDGTQALSVGPEDAVPRLWDVATGKRLPGPAGSGSLKDPPHEAAYTPDGRLAITAHDRKLRLWDLGERKELYWVELEGLHPNHVAISRDGRWVASANWRGSVSIWQLSERAALNGH
jgi:serine/threonine protein kinase/tetratricopeptide (TPR) repeat protein